MGKNKSPLWAALVLFSIACEVLLNLVHLPGSLLLGPMIAGIVFALAGSGLRLPMPVFQGGQALVGAMVAMSITPAVVMTVLGDWQLCLAVVGATILASGVVGWMLARWGTLPAPTAVWGTSAGAAGMMMLMSGHYGADMRMVGFMQYMRVLLVAGSAGLVGRFWTGTDATLPQMVWFPAIDTVDLLTTLAVALSGAWLGERFRVPAGPLVVPMALGAVLQGAGLIRLELPGWLVALSFATIGWNIGLGFTRALLIYALRALPQIVLSILALMAFGVMLAWSLVQLAGVDPLTAYLATSPGGMDSIAVIASSTNVDAGFVMALQVLRVFAVVATGPVVARFIVKRLRR